MKNGEIKIGNVGEEERKKKRWGNSRGGKRIGKPKKHVGTVGCEVRMFHEVMCFFLGGKNAWSFVVLGQQKYWCLCVCMYVGVDYLKEEHTTS